MLIKYSKLVDLSLKLHNSMSIYPGDPPLNIKTMRSKPKDRVNILGLDMSTHHGTHLDAPRHQLTDGEYLDKFPLNMLVNRALKIEVAPRHEGPGTNQKAGILYRRVVTAEDLTVYADLLAGVDAAVIHTGYGRVLVLGKAGDDFPYLDISAAELLADYQNLKLIGIDSLTVDAKGKNNVHLMLFGQGQRLLVETLVNLEHLPRYFTLCSLPLLIENSDGAPCRAIAFCE